MNKFAEDMLRARYGRDGRNPYGSRGGYVVSSRGGRGRGRDRGMMYDGGEDYARGGRGGNRGGGMRGGRGRSDYNDYDMNRMGDMRGDYYDEDYGYMEDDYRGYDERRDYADYGRGDYRSRDYRGEDYGYEDMRRGDYGRRGGRDYGEETEYGKLSHKDIKNWDKSFVNSDGSKGGKYKPEQIEQMSKSMGVRLDEMGGAEVFALAVNMMYADYCDVAKKFGVDRPEYYIALAKAFMEDKDFKGKGEEKLWLYYKCIAEQED